MLLLCGFEVLIRLFKLNIHISKLILADTAKPNNFSIY